MTNIAIIGSGIQGSAIAERLAGAGHRLFVHDRVADRMQALTALGATAMASAAAAIGAAEVALIIVDAGDAPEKLIEEPAVRAACTSGKTIVQMGNASVDATLRSAALVQAAGARFVEAVVLGPAGMILQGNCPMAYAGPPEAMEPLSGLLGAIGPLMPVGQLGQAAAFNLAALTAVYSMANGFALATAMVEKAGLDVETWLGFTRASVIGNAGGFLADFLYPAHLKHRDYALVGPCRVRTRGAAAETALLAEQAGKLGLADNLLQAIDALHRAASKRDPESDWTSVYEQLFVRR